VSSEHIQISNISNGATVPPTTGTGNLLSWAASATRQSQRPIAASHGNAQ